MHIKVEITKGNVANAVKSVESFRVLVLYTKTYNKWYPCDKGEQDWRENIGRGKYRVVARMIKFDHSMGKYKDVRPTDSVTWTWQKGSIYILCDASKIHDVVKKLMVE